MIPTHRALHSIPASNDEPVDDLWVLLPPGIFKFLHRCQVSQVVSTCDAITLNDPRFSMIEYHCKLTALS